MAAAPALEITAARRRPTILVADDSADNREMMQVLLGLKGYDVIVAENGKQAVEVALADIPDLILLDLDLPFWMVWPSPGIFFAIDRSHRGCFRT